MIDPETLSRYVVTPLSDFEISELETACRRPIPSPIREWLATAGMPQNVCFRMAEDECDLVKMQWRAPENMFAFAHDEELDAVLALDRFNQIQQISFENPNPVFVPGSLSDYLLANLAPPLPIAQTKWHTQLSFATHDEDRVIAELSHAFSLTAFTGWEYLDTSLANVVTYLYRCLSPRGRTKVSRQEFHGWETPSFYFNFQFPIADIRNGKSIFRRLRQLDLGFRLINYGLLDFDAANEADRTGEER